MPLPILRANAIHKSYGPLAVLRGVDLSVGRGGSPWENGYVERFDGKLRDELLNAEVFDTLAEAKGLIEGWRRHHNTGHPHQTCS